MIWLYVGFILFVIAMLALDLGVFHRKAHAVSLKEALGWSAVWITLALSFTIFIFFAYRGHWLGLGIYSPEMIEQQGYLLPQSATQAAIKYLTGYVIEWSLSVDNIFVIALIFGFFKIPAMYQHRVLFWGILGAVVMRGIFVGLGAALIYQFHWILYVFGVFLLFTAYKMLTADEDPDPSKNFLVRLTYKYFPVTPNFHGQKFVVYESELQQRERAEKVEPGEGVSEVDVTEHGRSPRETMGELPADAAQAGAPVPREPATKGTGRWVLTPLALALIVVEGTDLVFAVDSIPAIFSITTDPFIVFTSNIFAVMGLRAMYFALAGVLDKFHYLKTSLALVLGLIGVKMLVADLLKRNDFLAANLSFITLGLIVLILGGGVVASLVRAKRIQPTAPTDVPPV